MEEALVGFLLAVFAAVVFMGGWSAAHTEVSRECRLQGNFYVGSTVYKCEEKK